MEEDEIEYDQEAYYQMCKRIGEKLKGIVEAYDGDIASEEAQGQIKQICQEEIDSMNTTTETVVTTAERLPEEPQLIHAITKSKRTVFNDTITQGEFLHLFKDMFDNVEKIGPNDEDEFDDRPLTYKVW